MELNAPAHNVYCFDIMSILSLGVDNARGDLFLIRALLRQIQDLEGIERLTRRSSASRKWRKVHLVHEFTFHALYLSKQAAARRQVEDKLYTASFKWRHLQLFKCFETWAALKDKQLTKPRRAGIYPGKTGLRNLGNTCYMNAALQAIGHVDAIKEALEKHEGRRGSLLAELHQVVQRLWSGEYAAFSPDVMLKMIWILFPSLAGFKQQDCDELLRHLLDHLRLEAQAASPKSSPCFVENLFDGHLLHEVIVECSHTSETREPFLGELSVEIPQVYRIHSTMRRGSRPNSCQLTDCLAKFTAMEHLRGDAQYFCPSCNAKVNASKHTRLGSCPPVLIVHINRSDWVQDSQKIQSHVGFHEHGLDLTPFATNSATSLRYKLGAVVAHEGRSLTQGHYTAYAYNSYSTSWYHFNDHRVHKCTWSDVANAQAYLLVYERVAS
ncbi:unnamed protein product [Aphanomyces euteiches]